MLAIQIKFLVSFFQLFLKQNMKKTPCIPNENNDVLMTQKNLKICLKNQEGSFNTLELNQSLHLQYCGFCNIDNLKPFTQLHTLFLNNNAIEHLQNLQDLTQLKTLNLSYNRIKNVSHINHLKELYMLDLSSNFIAQLPAKELEGLSNLNHLKLKQNKLTSFESISGIEVLASSLTYLDLGSNEFLEYNPLIHTDFLSKLNITVLVLQNTLFSRTAPSYRKQTLLAAKCLKFLDQRQVTEDERMMAEAWKNGGLQLEKEMRAKINEKKHEKSNKIYSQMEERNMIVEQKRRLVLLKLTKNQTQTLSDLSKQRNQQDYELLSEQEKTILNLKIEELSKYMQRMAETVKSLDLEKQLNDGKVEIPMMVIDKQTPEVVYVYNISQEQLPQVIKKFYPNETRPIEIINNVSPQETRWIKQYDAILHQTYEQSRGKIQMLVPLFNLALYEFDESVGRKTKRFEMQELRHLLKGMRQEQESRQFNLHALDELD